MIWERVRGHQVQVEMFRQALRRDRFSQAYLLLGPEGIGKRLFVRTLAQCLFCETFEEEALDACGQCKACRLMLAGSHPDFLSLGCPEGKNVFPIELIAGTQERRGREGLCYDLTLRPMAAQRRIAVIDDAQRMNAESANALLKTLEEPPAYATLFLLAPQADALLPTIQSRCQAVRFSPLSDDTIAELLVDQGQMEHPAEAEAVAALSEGSLTLAKQLLDPELRKLREGLFNGLISPQIKPLELAKTLLDGLEQLDDDSHVKRRNASWLVRFAIEFFRRTLITLTSANGTSPIPQVPRFAERFNREMCEDLELVMRLLDRSIQAEAQLQRNAPPQMVFECLFDELARLLRQPTTASR